MNHTEEDQHLEFISSDERFLKVKHKSLTVLPGEVAKLQLKFKPVDEPVVKQLTLQTVANGQPGQVYEFEVTYAG